MASLTEETPPKPKPSDARYLRSTGSSGLIQQIHLIVTREIWNSLATGRPWYGNQEEFEARPLARGEVLFLVEGVEENLHQVGGEDHDCRVDKAVLVDSGHTVSPHLCAQDEEEVGEETLLVAVMLTVYVLDVEKNRVKTLAGRTCAETEG